MPLHECFHVPVTSCQRAEVKRVLHCDATARADMNVFSSDYFLTAETFSLQQLQISPKMFSEYSSGHFHHPVDLSCSSGDFPSFRTSRIRETSSGVKRSPFLLALVIRLSMTGARLRPVLPWVCCAASLISSSLAGSIDFIAGWFIHCSIC